MEQETNVQQSQKAENAFASVCRGWGIEVQTRPYKSVYDFLLNGSVRVEFKSAFPQNKDSLPIWKFNLHRHGVLQEACDYYVLRLEDVPYSRQGIYLLMKSPVRRLVVTITVKSLLNGQAVLASDFRAFMKKLSPTGR